MSTALSDAKITNTGFKHPDSIFGSFKQSLPLPHKPALIDHLKFPKKRSEFDVTQQSSPRALPIRYTRFGVNLGPTRPVIPLGKHEKKTWD